MKPEDLIIGKYYQFTTNHLDYFGQDRQRLANVKFLYVGKKEEWYSFDYIDVNAEPSWTYFNIKQIENLEEIN